MTEEFTAHGVAHSRVQTEIMDYLMIDAKRQYDQQSVYFKQLVHP